MRFVAERVPTGLTERRNVTAMPRETSPDATQPTV
jgi:hypothetical protein